MPSLGRVVSSVGTFSDDRLAAMTMYVEAERAEVEAKLAAKYPKSSEAMGRRIFLIDAAARSASASGRRGCRSRGAR